MTARFFKAKLNYLLLNYNNLFQIESCQLDLLLLLLLVNITMFVLELLYDFRRRNSEGFR